MFSLLFQIATTDAAGTIMRWRSGNKSNKDKLVHTSTDIHYIF